MATEYTIGSLTCRGRALLRACARRSDFEAGRKLHALAITTGVINLPNSYHRNAILQMYAACYDSSSARKTFNEIPITSKDTVDWTTLMGCYIRSGLPRDGINLFVNMQREGVSIDDITIVALFNSCAKVGDNVFGFQGHACMTKMGFGISVKACNAAIDMYVKCCLMGYARRVFDEMCERSVVSWTTLLGGVLKLEGLEAARLLFDQMPERNEFAWTMMISGYISNGFIKEGVRLLNEMVFGHRFCLDFAAICSLLSASAQSGDVVMGKWLHVYALRKLKNAVTDVVIFTALLDMYAKCGRINTALLVFQSMPSRNVITWNAMLSGLAMHGKGSDVLHMFDQMVKEVRPDEVTFTAVLSACSHSGLVDKGRQIFYNLQNLYSIKPSMEHYACMVDLLGRAGYLEEAENVIRTMPMSPNEVVLGSLLGSCSVHRKLQLGERLMKELVQIYPQNIEYHVLLSNMYAQSGKVEMANSLRMGVKKVPGMSSMHICGQVHHFTSGDKSHPQTEEIYLMLDEMIRKVRLAGYVPNLASQISSGGDVDGGEEEKEQALFLHSEKLAVSFGLISTRSGESLYVFKNLRICQDCHSFMKIVSKVYDREIIVRDRSRFHSFKLGSCSCSDYW